MSLTIYDDPELMAAVDRYIAGNPETASVVTQAVNDHLTSTGWLWEPGVDGHPHLVCEISILDKEGASVILRLDAARYGYYYDGAGSVIYEMPNEPPSASS